MRKKKIVKKKTTTKATKRPLVEVPDDFLDPQKARMKATFWLDGDLLDLVKKEAAERNVKYTQMLNIILRERLTSSPKSLDTRVAELEKMVFNKTS